MGHSCEGRLLSGHALPSWMVAGDGPADRSKDNRAWCQAVIGPGASPSAARPFRGCPKDHPCIRRYETPRGALFRDALWDWSAGYSFGALSRLGFGEVVGEFGGGLVDLVEDVEQRLLALGADAVDELACDLLDGG